MLGDGRPQALSTLIAGAPGAAQPAIRARSKPNANAISVSENGYSPAVLHLPANQPVSLEWVTDKTRACSRSVVVPDLNYQKILPVTGKVRFDIPAQAQGTVIRYTCSMGMYPSQFIFDLDPNAKESP
jgi:plastocyanin domain-containing protein